MAIFAFKQTMAKFKGTVYISTAIFAEQRFGVEARDRIIAALPAEHQDVLRGITAVGWYPVEPIMAFHRALDELYGKGDLALCVEAGNFSAEWTLNAVLKMLLRLRTPTWLFERSTTLWSRFHDSGRWETETGSDIQLTARLCEFEVRDAAFCARFRGWLHRAIELTGGKHPRVSHPQCVCDGAAYCQFECRWR